MGGSLLPDPSQGPPPQRLTFYLRQKEEYLPKEAGGQGADLGPDLPQTASVPCWGSPHCPGLEGKGRREPQAASSIPSASGEDGGCTGEEGG